MQSCVTQFSYLFREPEQDKRKILLHIKVSRCYLKFNVGFKIEFILNKGRPTHVNLYEEFRMKRYLFFYVTHYDFPMWA